MYTSFTTIKLIRYSVAYVFVISGLMKLVSSDLANGFHSLGLPYSHLLLKIVILLEIGCGVLLILNKSVHYAVIPLLAIMIAALLLTKLPLLHQGLLTFAFHSRLDIVMLVLLAILYKRYPIE